MNPAFQGWRRRAVITLSGLLIVVGGMTPAAWAQGSTEADTVYTGGPILTMNDAAPRAEAVAVRGGRIVAVGALKHVQAHAGAATRYVDLRGQALLPGFVDPHSHVAMIGLQAQSANLLAPPDGPVSDIASLLKALREFAKANDARVVQRKLLLGFGYDDSQLAEQRHPTRDDLDAISRDFPVYLIHQSGHLGVSNSKGLELAGIHAKSLDIPGGVIRRGADGVPDGVLEENAHFTVMGKLFTGHNEAVMREMFIAGARLAAQFGYTTATEGRAAPEQALLMKAVADAGELPIDVIAFVDVLSDRAFIARHAARTYTNRFRVGGAKLTIDGSPQGFTALRDRPYHAPPAALGHAYAGYSAVQQRVVDEAVDWAYAQRIQLQTHANGEGAADMLIGALRGATERHGAADRRPVLVHGQFERLDQAQSFVELGVVPSLFPMHTFYWGDWHRDRTVGPLAADNISPVRWYLDRGARFTTHHDAPVAFPDAIRVLAATVTRRSRSGDIIGPAHRVDAMTALKAMTIWPAWQHFEEERKGSIEVGKLADFVILDRDPTAMDPERLATLRVMRTIKEDKAVYERRTE